MEQGNNSLKTKQPLSVQEVEAALEGKSAADAAADPKFGGGVYNEAKPGNEAKYSSTIQMIGSGPFYQMMPIDYKWLPLFFWPFVVPILLVAIVVGVIPFFFGVWNNIVHMTFFTCCFNCWGNPPTWSYWLFCVNAISTLAVLAVNKGRLGLFQAYQKICGGAQEAYNGCCGCGAHPARRANDYWWAMSGIMCWSYKTVDDITKNFQKRGVYFGNNQASVPGVFPPGVSESVPGSTEGGFLLWISGPKHTAYRRAFHTTIIGQYDLIKQRFGLLETVLAPVFSAFGRTPSSAAEYKAMANQKMPGKSWTLGSELMSRTMWWVVFGCKLDDEEMAMAAGWKGAAAFFILPQFVQNLACGILTGKVTKLRRQMVAIICKRPGLVAVFERMNGMLDLTPQGGLDYSNKNLTQTMDEVQFAVNFAGLLGSSQLLMSALDMLNKDNTANIPPKSAPTYPPTLGPGKLDYITAYNENPVAFLKEVARLDPPVTSANATTLEPKTIDQNPCLFGGKMSIPAGTPNQYLLSLAVRDDEEFPDPGTFDPYRTNWNSNLCWNGQFPFAQESRRSGGRMDATAFAYDPMAAPTYDPNGESGAPLPLTATQASNYNRVCPGRNIALQAVCMILGMCPALNKTPLTIKVGDPAVATGDSITL